MFRARCSCMCCLHAALHVIFALATRLYASFDVSRLPPGGAVRSARGRAATGAVAFCGEKRRGDGATAATGGVARLRECDMAVGDACCASASAPSSLGDGNGFSSAAAGSRARAHTLSSSGAPCCVSVAACSGVSE